MASYERCMQEVLNAVGRELTNEELRRLDKQVTKIVDKLSVGEHVEKYDDLLMREIAKAGDLAQAAAIIQKRNAVKDMIAIASKRDHLRSVWSDDLNEGLRAVLQGSVTGRKTSKASTATAQVALSHRYQMGVASDLDKAGVTEWVAKGSFDKETWTAMWELNKATPDQAALAKLPKEAVTAAGILNTWQELARTQANQAGAWIGKLDGYVTRHTHDQLLIKQAGEQQWLNDAVQWFDWERTMPDVPYEERMAALKRLYWDFASGTHIKFVNPPATQFQGVAGAAKSLSHERALHFKSADAEFQYNAKYGAGNLREAVFNNLARMGRETALMRDWGPNARANYDKVVRDLVEQKRNAGDVAAGESLVREAAHLDRILWPHLDGSIFRVEDAVLARRSANLRGLEMMSDLGYTTLRSISDLPILATAARQQGVGMFRGILDGIDSLVHGVSSGERLHVLAETGIIIDAVRNDLADRVGVDGGQTGSIAKMTQLYFNLNLLRPWTDRLRGGFVLATAHRLANHSTLEFAGLPAPMQHLLKQYGIADAEWGVIRQAKESTADGKAFLTPEGLSDISVDALAPYALATKGSSDAPTIEAAREGLKDKLRSFFQDQATTAVVEPDTATRALLLQGSHRGTWTGEAYRHFMMYKSFTAGVMRRVLGREVHGYGEQSIGTMQALLNAMKDPGGSSFVGLANLIAYSTAFGYASIAMTDLAKGREPRTATTPEQAAQLIAASIVQGGGMGIYGDFIFGEMKGRFGQGVLETFLGPTWRRAEDIGGLLYALREGSDVTSKGLKTVFNNIPFANLFYTKWALDYLVLYRLQEMSNPGYLRRMEERARQAKGQEYIFPPSQAIPYGG